MADHLIAPLDGVIECTAIDSPETIGRDDAFRFTERGSMFQVDIAVVIPPFEMLNISTLLWFLFASKSEHHGALFSNKVKKAYGFSEKPKNALICSYVFSNQEELYLCELSIGKAAATKVAHIDLKKGALERHLMIAKLLTKVIPNPSSFFKKSQFMRLGVRVDFTQMLVGIFNETCRSAALRHNVNSIGVRSAGIELDPSGARFNKPLRDVESLINLVNLICAVTSTTIPPAFDIETNFPRLFEPRRNFGIKQK